MNWNNVLLLVQALGVFVGLTFTVMMSAGLVSSLFYRTSKSDERAENVRLVIPTVAAEHIRPALMETIEQTVSSFPEYEVYCLLDEGSDLQDELVTRDDVSTVVVPDDYDCEAVAKGRAINYFVEAVVSDAPEYWYAFIDDDNRILSDDFLYEIPYYEARGYRAMNPVLVPRRGRSMVTFMSDHIRYVDDISLYRLFTGVLGKPYLGFHGELLCVRGDVLADIGFDRDTIVEDFAFALELVDRDIPVWQSRTHVSILSPHDVSSFLQQRARWYLGIARYLPNAPLATRVVVGARITIWTTAVASSWVFLPLWVFGHGIGLPFWIPMLLTVGGLLYAGTIGLGAWRVGGLTGAVLLLLTPVYATLEQVAPLYALLTKDTEFVVIDK